MFKRFSFKEYAVVAKPPIQVEYFKYTKSITNLILHYDAYEDTN